MIYLLLLFVGAATPLIEYMIAIPIAMISGVSTIPAIIVGFAGNLTTVILFIWLGDKVRSIIRKRKKQNKPVTDAAVDAYKIEKQEQGESESTEDVESVAKNNTPTKSKRAQKAKKLWDKFGMPGLTFFGTGLLSSHLTALMACSFGGNRAYVTIWMTISIAIWSIITGGAVHFGIDVFSQ